MQFKKKKKKDKKATMKKVQIDGEVYTPLIFFFPLCTKRTEGLIQRSRSIYIFKKHRKIMSIEVPLVSNLSGVYEQCCISVC